MAVKHHDWTVRVNRRKKKHAFVIKGSEREEEEEEEECILNVCQHSGRSTGGRCIFIGGTNDDRFEALMNRLSGREEECRGRASRKSVEEER